MEPKQFGKYTLTRLLGRGGMAEVWLARDTNLGRQVALKLLPLGAEISRPTSDRFVREAQMMAQLNSSRIVTVFDMGVIEARFFIAMEYLDGRSLAQEIEAGGPKPWSLATHDIREAAIALRDAHAAGVIHRDVKPSNIMRGRQGGLVVVDFGLARLDSETSQLSQPGSVLGTPPFMSPEQCCGESVDQRSDLYSLICTYYALLVGRAPFTPGRAESIIYKQIHVPFPDPSVEVADLPKAVCALIEKGTRKDPAGRFQTAEELIAALDGIVGQPPVERGARPSAATPPVSESSDGVYLADDGGGGAPGSPGRWSWSDLTITIQERTANGHPILIVAPQTYGRPDNVMEFDSDSEPVRSWLQKIESDTCSERDIEEFGAYLFGRLFPGDFATTYELNVSRHLDPHQRRGLRIVLHVLSARLREVPWELAFQRIRGVFLGSNHGVAMSRLVTGVAVRPRVSLGVLRVLLCAAAPRALAATDATIELTTIEDATRPRPAEGRIQTRVVRDCTRGDLIRALDEFRPHVFHFVGHGETRGRVRGIILEGGQEGEFVGAELLRDLLGKPGSVRFAILTACRSGGIAYALAESGVPAVGMLTDVANRAAVTFSRSLYRALVQGHAVDRAVSVARRAVRVEVSQDRRDWFAPIVVLPQGIGELFEWEAEPARIHVDSAPGGARIFVNGEPTETTTPAVVALRHGGRHLVQVGLATGGISAGKVVTPVPGSMVAVHFEIPAPAPVGARGARLGWFAAVGLVAVILVVLWLAGVLRGGGSAPAMGGDNAALRARLLPAHEMVEIPAGTVHVGTLDASLSRDASLTVELLRARKQRLGTVSQARRQYLDGIYKILSAAPRRCDIAAFEIDRYEVTNGEYRAFLDAVGGLHTHCHPDEPAGQRHAPRQWGADEDPVTTIDWFDAYAYARWKGRRLPTEDEWELAARGPSAHRYPWGDSFDATQFGPRGASMPPARGWVAPRPGSPCAMAGGVREWTATTADGGEMTIKGGSHIDGDEAEIYALGFARAPTMARTSIARNVGFRCVRDPLGETPADMVAVPGASVTLGGETSPGLELLRRLESTRFVWDVLGETVTVPGFRIDKFEVSNLQYRRFLDYVAATRDHGFCVPGEPAGKDHRPQYFDDAPFTADDQPVVGVDWYDARAYANWAGKRLPRLDEWVRAARGDSFRRFPWGDSLDAGRSSCAEFGGAAPAPVTGFAGASSLFGVVQMAGNATEWTFDELSGTSRAYVLGGGWNEPGEVGLLFNHPSASITFRDRSSGFRCAEDLR